MLEIKGNLILYKGKGVRNAIIPATAGDAIMNIENRQGNQGCHSKRKGNDEIELFAETVRHENLKDNCSGLALSGITTMEEYIQVVYKM